MIQGDWLEIETEVIAQIQTAIACRSSSAGVNPKILYSFLILTIAYQ